MKNEKLLKALNNASSELTLGHVSNDELEMFAEVMEDEGYMITPKVLMAKLVEFIDHVPGAKKLHVLAVLTGMVKAWKDVNCVEGFEELVETPPQPSPSGEGVIEKVVMSIAYPSEFDFSDLRSTIILGPAKSGKTVLAKEIVKQYDADKVCWVGGREMFGKNQAFGQFRFNECTADTELVVIDDIPQTVNIHDIRSFVINGITVNKPGHEAFVINPRIVFTFSKTPFNIHYMKLAGLCQMVELIETPPQPSPSGEGVSCEGNSY